MTEGASPKPVPVLFGDAPSVSDPGALDLAPQPFQQTAVVVCEATTIWGRQLKPPTPYQPADLPVTLPLSNPSVPRWEANPSQPLFIIPGRAYDAQETETAQPV
jgi:hypothetical protein